MGIDMGKYEGHEIEQDDKEASLSDRMKGIEARNALRDDAPALLAEVQRLRGIVPETLETLNDELCAENEKLRADLAEASGAIDAAEISNHCMRVFVLRAMDLLQHYAEDAADKTPASVTHAVASLQNALRGAGGSAIVEHGGGK